MPRKRRVPPDAEPQGFYLTPSEQLVLQTIRARRKHREEERTGQSEVVVDALWLLLEEVEGISREQVAALLRNPPRKASSKIKSFPKSERA